MEGALIGSGQRLWIYDSPVSHKYGMLKPALMRRYNHLFDLAEKAVAAEHAKASIRCKVEHVFAVVKGMFRFRKTRLRGFGARHYKCA